VHRWLHEKALPRIESETGLYHPEGDFDYADAWADCYPFLVWAAWATDPQALNGPIRRALKAERQWKAADYFTKPDNFFGASEYVKDGLVPIVEVTGHDIWFQRMKTIEQKVWANPEVETEHGRIPSKNVEIHGEQLQVLPRLYTMTGNEQYLRWAERIGDYYLLREDRPFVPRRLRDHGCELIGGLGLLLAVMQSHDAGKAQQYQPRIKAMYDAILDRGTNEDGLMYNKIDGANRDGWAGQLSDGWGYNYVGFLCYDMIAKVPRYRARIKRTLTRLDQPKYQNYPWEGNMDGDADAIEGAIYLHNRLPSPVAREWIDREIANNITRPNQPLKKRYLWDTHKLHSNAVRTTIMHALMHTRGVRALPWQAGLKLGATETENGLAVMIETDKDWSGRLVFDIARHRRYLGFRRDWPRMNTLPEWFTVKPNASYRVHRVKSDRSQTFTGQQLHEALKLELNAGETTWLRVERNR
jgi:hypothetical protein